MAVATNWFDSHSFLCVFLFLTTRKSIALKLHKRKESLLLYSFGIVV